MRAAVLLVAALSLAAGCTDKLSFSSASVDEPAFEVTPTKGDANTVFKVDAKGLGKHNVTWDFGDQTLAYGGAAEHKYGFTNGRMTITMLVTDGAKQGVATREVVLGSGVNAKPTASISASKTWVEARQAVSLNARSNDADRDALRYLWTYRVLEGGAAADDGHGHEHGAAAAPAAPSQEAVIDTTKEASVIFDAPGKYAVKLRVTDPKGGEATSETKIDVSSRIPDPVYEVKFSGVLAAGTAGQPSASEQLWATPAPDTFVDAARHPYTLLYPATTVIVLTWNDTTTVGGFDLDLELRASNGTTIFKSDHHANPGPPPIPAAPFEFNFTQQPPGDYVVIVRNYAGARVAYDLLVHASLTLTPELVAAVEGK